METKTIAWSESSLAVKALKEGKIVCFPTETVYGMGVIASSKDAFDELVAVKRRSPDKPFTLMCANATQAMQYAQLNVGLLAVMHKFMPGEITVLVKPRANIAPWVTLNSSHIGIRIPGSEEVCAMIEAVGCPLLVPSANRSGEPTSSSYEDTMKTFEGEVPLVIKGECTGKLASTIVMFGEDGLKLVREGPIPFKEIEEAYDDAEFTVSLASDHGGYALKEAIKEHLLSMGMNVTDCGTNSTASCDYPVFGEKAAREVAEGNADLGIVVCTSGEGIMMAANKVPGIRCGIGYDDVVTGKCREHNNANMISFGAAYMKEEDVLRRVDIFLAEQVSPLSKHHRRVDMVNAIC